MVSIVAVAVLTLLASHASSIAATTNTGPGLPTSPANSAVPAPDYGKILGLGLLVVVLPLVAIVGFLRDWARTVARAAPASSEDEPNPEAEDDPLGHML